MTLGLRAHTTPVGRWRNTGLGEEGEQDKGGWVQVRVFEQNSLGRKELLYLNIGTKALKPSGNQDAQEHEKMKPTTLN